MSQNTTYILVSGGMAIAGAVAVVAITSIRPEQDNAVIIATILGLMASTTASILSFLKAQETHLIVNSRLDEFIAAAKAQGRALGKAQGVKEANKRTDKLRRNK